MIKLNNLYEMSSYIYRTLSLKEEFLCKKTILKNRIWEDASTNTAPIRPATTAAATVSPNVRAATNKLIPAVCQTKPITPTNPTPKIKVIPIGI